MCGSLQAFSIASISSLTTCTLSLVPKSFLKPSLVACNCSRTPFLRRASIEAFSFSSFLRKVDILTRSSGDWRYSPTACAADMGAAAIIVVGRSPACGIRDVSESSSRAKNKVYSKIVSHVYHPLLVSYRCL